MVFFTPLLTFIRPRLLVIFEAAFFADIDLFFIDHKFKLDFTDSGILNFLCCQVEGNGKQDYSQDTKLSTGKR